MTYEERETKYYESEELKHGLRNNTDKVSLFRLKRQAETPQRFVSSFLSQRGLEPKMAEYRFVNNWSQIVGEGIAAHAKPMMLKNRILYIGVSSASWMQELSFQKMFILSKLNEFFGKKNRVIDLKFISNK